MKDRRNNYPLTIDGRRIATLCMSGVVFFATPCIEGAEIEETGLTIGGGSLTRQGGVNSCSSRVTHLFEDVVLGEVQKIEALQKAAYEEQNAVSMSLYAHAALHTGEDAYLVEADNILGENMGLVLEAAGSPGEEGKDKQAQLCLGISYLWGHGVEENTKVALKWLLPLKDTMPLVQRLLDATAQEEEAVSKRRESAEGNENENL